MTTRSVSVDAERCIGAGNCEFRAPATFRLNEEGVSEVIDPMGDGWSDIDMAVYECPMAAISAVRGGEG